MTTVKLTRIGSPIIDTIPLEKFNNAVKRGNIIDNIVYINDIAYNYSSVQIDFPAPPPPALFFQIINCGSITKDDLNVAAGQSMITKNFGSTKPAGKRIINTYCRVQTPFAGAPGAPLPAFAQVLSEDNFYGPSNPIPNAAGFMHTFPLVAGALSPTNTNLLAGVRGVLNLTGNIPSSDLYTAGEMEFWIQVEDIPAPLLPPVV